MPSGIHRDTAGRGFIDRLLHRQGAQIVDAAGLERGAINQPRHEMIYGGEDAVSGKAAIAVDILMRPCACAQGLQMDCTAAVKPQTPRSSFQQKLAKGIAGIGDIGFMMISSIPASIDARLVSAVTALASAMICKFREVIPRSALRSCASLSARDAMLSKSATTKSAGARCR